MNCGRHTCLLPCHSGPCPACPVIMTITCECGRTTCEVPCKDYRKSLYPDCPYLCNKPSNCHHITIQDHYCHAGACPRCLKECGLELPCGHSCHAICHDGTSCPPCHEVVKKECIGGHMKVSVLCCEKEQPVHCDQICGRLLACKKHVLILILIDYWIGL